MTPTLREAGLPSPLHDGTHDDADLRPTIPFDAAAAPAISDLDEAVVALDAFAADQPAPAWAVTTARLIRPLCVGALMSIPTIGTATVGTVALFNGAAADRMVRASIAFLGGLPGEVLLLIGTLATGYGFAKTFERLKGANR